MTTLAANTGVTLTVTATDMLLIDCPSGGRARVEALTGVDGASTRKILVEHPGGRRQYGPFGAGTISLGSIGAALRYDYGGNPRIPDPAPALYDEENQSLVSGDGTNIIAQMSFCRWCIPGKDTSGTLFKDVSGNGNDGTIEASNSTPFAVDNRISTVAHASAGGVAVPLAATLCDFTTDSVVMAFTLTNEDPAGSEAVASFGAGTGNHPGMYLSHRASAAGVARVVCNRGNGTLVSGSDSTVKFSNAGGTRETHVLMALDGPTGSVYLYRDGVLAASNVGLMTSSNAFTLAAPVFAARLGSTGGTAATVAGVFRGWQGYVFEGKGLPLNIGQIAAFLAENPSVPVNDVSFKFA